MLGIGMNYFIASFYQYFAGDVRLLWFFYSPFGSSKSNFIAILQLAQWIRKKCP